MATARFKLQNYVQQQSNRERIFQAPDSKTRLTNQSFFENEKENLQDNPPRGKSNSYHYTNSLEVALQPPKSSRPPLFDTSRLATKCKPDLNLTQTRLSSELRVSRQPSQTMMSNESQKTSLSQISRVVALPPSLRTEGRPHGQSQSRRAFQMFEILQILIGKRQKHSLDMMKVKAFINDDSDYLCFTTVTIETTSNMNTKIYNSLNRFLQIYERKVLIMKCRKFNQWKSHKNTVSLYNKKFRQIQERMFNHQRSKIKMEILKLVIFMRKFQRQRPAQRDTSLGRTRNRSIF